MDPTRIISTTRISDLPLAPVYTPSAGAPSTQYAPNTHQQLPSRDMPAHTHTITQDEQMQPNYIPKIKLTTDYIAESEAALVKKHRDQKLRNQQANDLTTKLQLPVAVAILFFIFQMPGVTHILYQCLHTFPFYNADGNFNHYGIIAKSLIFGAAFYLLECCVT